MKENYEVNLDDNEANELEEKACNVDLPGLGKMKFLPYGGVFDGPNFNVANVGVDLGLTKGLAKEELTKDLNESHKAFWACGIGADNIGVSKAVENCSNPEVVGMDLCRYGFNFDECNDTFKINLFNINGSAYAINLLSADYIKRSRILLVDGYCNFETKKEIARKIADGSFRADCVVFIKRSCDSEGTKLIEEELKKRGCESNVIRESDYNALTRKGKELYAKLIGEELGEKGFESNVIREGDYNALTIKGKELYAKLIDEELGEKVFESLIQNDNDNDNDNFTNKAKRRKKFRNLIGKVKENKGKTAFGFVSFLGLEELLRRNFFSGEKTNEKEKAKKFKKVS